MYREPYLVKVASWVCVKTGTYEYRIMLCNLLVKKAHISITRENNLLAWQWICMTSAWDFKPVT